MRGKRKSDIARLDPIISLSGKIRERHGGLNMKKGPKFQRKQETIQRWLELHGLKKIPKGYELDHKIPLSQGGTDTLRNLHLIKTKRHKIKTAKEARKRNKR